MLKTNRARSRFNVIQSLGLRLAVVLVLLGAMAATGAGSRRFDIREYGANGKEDARPAIQKAIDAAAAAGGGTVFIPPGLYTSGTLHLRSHIRIELASGATLLASKDRNAYDCGADVTRAALFSGEDLQDIAFSGGGIVDGQAEYEWRADDYEEGFDHKTLMQKLGKPLLRSFPKDFPKREVFPHLVWLARCRNIQVSGLNFLHSPAWTFALYDCRHAAFDGLYLYTSLKEAVWADGIDLDSCRDVLIANCTIETGDDCVALVSENRWGPPGICENVTITHCRLSTASAGIKFSEGNRAGIRNIRVKDCLFNNVNRGFAMITARGGSISDVVLSDVTINCRRFDWFWAGDAQPVRCRSYRLHEIDPAAPAKDDVAPGVIRGLTLRNVVAHAQGSSMFYGHPERWLEDITLDHVKLFVSSDPTAPYDTAEHALDFRRVKNLKLSDVEVAWKEPRLGGWKSALNCEEVDGVALDGFSAGPAFPGCTVPVIALRQVTDASIRHNRALTGTDVFVEFNGAGTRNIRLQDNDFTSAKTPLKLGPEVPVDAFASRPK